MGGSTIFEISEGQKSKEARTILKEERQNDYPEPRIQAFILESQLLLREERPQEALSLLDNISAQELGPAWDATLEELRAAAFFELDQPNESITVLENLAQRWPSEEEAQLPALLGIADLYRGMGEMKRAKDFATKAQQTAQDPNYRARAEQLLKEL